MGLKLTTEPGERSEEVRGGMGGEGEGGGGRGERGESDEARDDLRPLVAQLRAQVLVIICMYIVHCMWYIVYMYMYTYNVVHVYTCNTYTHIYMYMYIPLENFVLDAEYKWLATVYMCRLLYYRESVFRREERRLDCRHRYKNR